MQPSNWNGWMVINGPSSGPGGRATFPAQAHDEAWCTGGAVRERADGLFFHFGLVSHDEQ
jgi:hypothetical protein